MTKGSENFYKMDFYKYNRFKPLLICCKVNFFIVITLALVLQVTCTQGNPCRLIRKWRWSCEGINFVPRFHPNTTAVTFWDLQIPHLDNKTFQNLTELHILRYVIIKSTSIVSCTTGVFSYLKHLIGFEIIRSKLSMSQLRNLYFGLPVNIYKIVLYDVDLHKSDRNLFDGLRGTNCTLIYFKRCTLLNFDGEYFAGMNSLRLISAFDNLITSVKRWAYLPNLNYLDLYYNKISYFPSFKNKTGHPFYPKLEKLYLWLWKYTSLDSSFFSGLAQIRKLGINLDRIWMFRAKLCQEMKYLQSITLLSFKHHLVRFERDVFNSNFLESLQLINIRIRVNNDLPSSLLKSCTHLRNLILKNATVNVNVNDLLKPLTKLKNLEIFEGGLTAMPDAICNITTLRTLTIQRTSVNEWNKGMCPVMTSLKLLVLRHNKIIYVDKKSFSNLLFSNENLRIDFSFNQFICDCRTLWFRDWMKKNAKRIINHKNYHCFTPSSLKHIRLQNFSLSWEYCENRGKPSNFAVAGIAIAVLAVMFVFTAILSYTKRWSIRFCIYQAFVRKKKYKALVNDDQYKYDAFVCYCSADINWVLNKLLPIIEEENHFNLCLHDRDFLVGNDIVDNIVDSMQQSRKVVLVLSDHFAQSSWCQFEASIAQQKILEDHYDIIIPVLLNEIPSSLQTKRLGVLLKQKTYLEWPNEDQFEEMFWERFIRRLKENVIDNEI